MQALVLDMPHRVLVIRDDSATSERPVIEWLSKERYLCESLAWRSLNAAELIDHPADVVVPVALPRLSSRSSEFLEWIRRQRDAPATLAIVPNDADRHELKALAEVVDDFVFWPAGASEVEVRLARLIGLRSDQASLGRLSAELGLANLIGTAPAFVRVLDQLPRLATSDVPVLISGETGTGKELCARALHHLSRRASCAFVPIDCGALPDQLFENEVFGHVRGAYTDAYATQKGLIALAEGGVLFLDEVDALSHAAQAKLLRFLQEHSYRPLGAERFCQADVRVIAASNRDLLHCVEEGSFRRDLYYRLSVLPLQLPPLRERLGDIAPLARYFLATLRPDSRLALSYGTLRKLSQYHWPGNVRELQNVMQHAALVCDGPRVLPGHIPLSIEVDGPAVPTGGRFSEGRAQAVAAFERDYVALALAEHGGNVTRAAAAAGKERRAFGRLVKKYGLKA